MGKQSQMRKRQIMGLIKSKRSLKQGNGSCKQEVSRLKKDVTMGQQVQKGPSVSFSGPVRKARRKRLPSPLKPTNNNSSQCSSPEAKFQLNLVDTEQDVGVDVEAIVEDISAGVDRQPRRQP